MKYPTASHTTASLMRAPQRNAKKKCKSCLLQRGFWVLLSALLLVVSLEIGAAGNSGYIPEKLKLIESLSSKKEVRQFSFHLDLDGDGPGFEPVFLLTAFVFQSLHVWNTTGAEFRRDSQEDIEPSSSDCSSIRSERAPPAFA